MDHPIIVTFQKGQLGTKDKERMTKRGILWLEAEYDHTTIQQIAISQPLVQSVLTGDAIVVSALKAISQHAGEATLRAFVRGLAEAVKTPNVEVRGAEQASPAERPS
jgi:hypothetical protein